MKSLPGSQPAALTASRMVSMVSSSLDRFGAKPPSSPTEVARPFAFRIFARLWNTSAHQRSASLKVGAPTGIIMNSCVSTVLVACAPPFKIFIIGTGSLLPDTPPKNRYSGISREIAAALAAAMETARMAFAPRRDLSFVPSTSIIALSTAQVSDASIPFKVSLMTVLMFSTAFCTPFPRYLALSPSRNSSASNSPVDAPLGAMPRPTTPPARTTSASTVGFPLESRISLPFTSSIFRLFTFRVLLSRLFLEFPACEVSRILRREITMIDSLWLVFTNYNSL